MEVVQSRFGGGEHLQNDHQITGDCGTTRRESHQITHPHAITFNLKMRLEFTHFSPLGVRMWSSDILPVGGNRFTPRIIPDSILPDNSIHFIQFPGDRLGMREEVFWGLCPSWRISLLSSIFTPGDEITIGDPTHTLGEEDSKPIFGPIILNFQDDSNGTGRNFEAGGSPVAKFPAWVEWIDLGVIYYKITGKHGNILIQRGGGLHFIQFP